MKEWNVRLMKWLQLRRTDSSDVSNLQYLRKEKEQLRKENEQLRKEKEQLRKEKEQLRKEKEQLRDKDLRLAEVNAEAKKSEQGKSLV